MQILTQQMAKLQDTLNEANQVCTFVPMRLLFYYVYFSLLTEYYLLFDNYSIDSPFPEKFRYLEPWWAQFCFIIRIVSLHLSWNVGTDCNSSIYWTIFSQAMHFDQLFSFFLLDSDTWNSRERRKEKSTDLKKPWPPSRTRWKKNSNISWGVLVFISKSKWEWTAFVDILTSYFLFASLYLGHFVCRRNGADCRKSQVLVRPY